MSLSSITSRLTELLFTLPCILIALTFHEVAHGWMAYRLGDPTARSLGRLSLNPLKHLDPIGTLCMILFHFGWARPVPVNSRYFKKPRRDMALTAAAGPAMNIILAFGGLLVQRLLIALFSAIPFPSSEFLQYIEIAAVTLFYYFHIINLSLGVFNLIPVPPLDGSRIFLVWLPAKYYFGVMKYERYIQFGLLVLLWLGLLNGLLSAVVSALSGAMSWVIGLIPFL